MLLHAAEFVFQIAHSYRSLFSLFDRRSNVFVQSPLGRDAVVSPIFIGGYDLIIIYFEE